MVELNINGAKAPEPLGFVVPGTQVRVSNEHAQVRVPGSAPETAPRVEVVRDGEIVQALDVHCTCGRHVRLRCVYE